MTATTPVRTGTVPSANRTRLSTWLDNQKRLLLPVPHFMVTFTLPDELRELARRHQKTLYNILFRSSSEALQELALDPRFIGGRIGLVGVLHTWTRDRRYHPHVHYIVATSLFPTRIGTCGTERLVVSCGSYPLFLKESSRCALFAIFNIG